MSRSHIRNRNANNKPKHPANAHTKSLAKRTRVAAGVTTEVAASAVVLAAPTPEETNTENFLQLLKEKYPDMFAKLAKSFPDLTRKGCRCTLTLTDIANFTALVTNLLPMAFEYTFPALAAIAKPAALIFSVISVSLNTVFNAKVIGGDLVYLFETMFEAIKSAMGWIGCACARRPEVGPAEAVETAPTATVSTAVAAAPQTWTSWLYEKVESFIPSAWTAEGFEDIRAERVGKKRRPDGFIYAR